MDGKAVTRLQLERHRQEGGRESFLSHLQGEHSGDGDRVGKSLGSFFRDLEKAAGMEAVWHFMYYVHVQDCT